MKEKLRIITLIIVFAIVLHLFFYYLTKPLSEATFELLIYNILCILMIYVIANLGRKISNKVLHYVVLIGIINIILVGSTIAFNLEDIFDLTERECLQAMLLICDAFYVFLIGKIWNLYDETINDGNKEEYIIRNVIEKFRKKTMIEVAPMDTSYDSEFPFYAKIDTEGNVIVYGRESNGKAKTIEILPIEMFIKTYKIIET